LVLGSGFLVLLLLVAALAAIAAVMWRTGSILEHQRQDAIIQQLLATFAPAIASVQQDPKQLLVWYPLAQACRKLYPDAFKELDRATRGTFPFTKEQVQTAHARCTSDWLAWERAHDAEYALKAAQVQDEIDRVSGAASPLLRTRLAAIDQQKLERYQQRYEEYIKTAKALAALLES
jgi:hypothetical protein